MSEYIDQLLTERRVNLARIAELEEALHNMLCSAIPGMNWTDDIGQLILTNARNALKGTK